MSLRAKLDTIFFIYSNGSYLTNLESKEYQVLANLITIRNQVAHSRPYIGTFNIEYTEEEDGSQSFCLPQEFVDKSTTRVNKLSISELEFLLKAAIALDVSIDYEESYRSSPLCINIQRAIPADR